MLKMLLNRIKLLNVKDNSHPSCHLNFETEFLKSIEAEEEDTLETNG